jgi:hypothetical protein
MTSTFPADAHTHRPTSFFIEDILLNKPKQIYREFQPITLPRSPLAEYASYAYMNPAFLHHQALAHHYLPKPGDHRFLLPATGKNVLY